MKVSVVRGGGLAGIMTTTTLDAVDLSPQDAKALRAKVAAAAITGPHPKSAAAQPDRFAYELTVDADGERKTVRVGEADLTPQLQELLAWIQAAPARRQGVRPPGRA